MARHGDAPVQLVTSHAGRGVILPKHTWPEYTCTEENVTGWDAVVSRVVFKAKRSSVIFHFVLAVTIRRH